MLLPLYQIFTMMKPYILTLFIFICAVLSLNSCKDKSPLETETIQTSSANSPASKNVDTTVVLKIGNERFTVFELEKNFKLFKQRFMQNQRRGPVEADIKAWITEFVERAYVLADAREKGYYKRPDIQQIVESTSMLMLSQPHGIFEQKMLESATPGVPGMKISEREKKMAAIANYNLKINKSAAVITDKAAIDLLWTTIYKNKKVNEVKKEEVANILNTKLATYRMPNGKPGDITVKRFTDYYNGLPLRRYLEDTSGINMYVHQIAENEYIKKDAQKMGLFNDPEFRLNKKNFTDNTVYQKYMEEQLGKSRGVTESDVINVYTSVKKTITHPTDITYSIFTFSTGPTAYKALGLLHMRPNDTTVNLNSLSQKRHIKFDRSRSQLPDTLKKMILRVAPGQTSPPIETDGYYTVLMVESATGSEPFTANEIRPYLVARAREQRELNYCSKKANELGKNLKAENNIDIKTLLRTGLTASL